MKNCFRIKSYHRVILDYTYNDEKYLKLQQVQTVHWSEAMGVDTKRRKTILARDFFLFAVS